MIIRSIFFVLFLVFQSLCLAQKPDQPNQVPPQASKPSTASDTKKKSCSISEFKALGLRENVVQQRTKLAQEWLSKNSDSCTYDELLAIYYNRTLWLGTADSPHIAVMIESAMEQKNKENAERMYQEGSDKDGKKVLKDVKK